MKKCIAFIIALIIMFQASSPAYSCTIFNASDGSKILVGNNEDGFNTDARIWFLPSEKGSHGMVLFGFDDAWVQGGMNDQGLFIDWATEEPLSIDFPGTGISYKGSNNILYEANLSEKILKSCSNLGEAIDIFKKYNEAAFRNAHVMLADKSGASVIIEPYDGKLKVLKKENNYQFMTNFNISRSKLYGYGCNRYSTLEMMFKHSSDVTADNFRSLLSKVSQDITVYSNIYDLKKGDISLYYLHDFTKEIKFNLKTELSKGKHIYALKTLFHKNMPDYSTYNVNNKNVFSRKDITINVLSFLYLAIFILWAVLCLLKLLLLKRRPAKGQTFQQSLVMSLASAIPGLNGLICVIFLNGLIKYGFFIRYQFTFYQKTLFYIPYVIIVLTIVQLLFLVYSWKKSYWSLPERILYSLTTVCFIATSINLQSWCWNIF